MAANKELPTVLEGIVTARRGHLEEIAKRIAHVDVDKLPKSTRSLYDNLKANGGRGGANFIMECKSSSPSLGMIREHYQPGDIARVYSRYASGISVLCEPERFSGDYDHLATVAMSTHLPVLCKDFIIDKVQVHAARYYGADAILLMLSVLSDDEYAELHAEADRFGLDVLTEVIDEDEVTRAIKLGAKIFGVNHRNLHDLTIDLGRSAQLDAVIPADAVLISESGIRDAKTVRELGGHSNGFLVGSQLTGQPDIDLAARELVYGPNKVCGLTSATAAQTARAAGAVYGGLIFEEKSPRNVSRETAQKIMHAEPNLKYVAVSRRTEGWGQLASELARDLASPKNNEAGMNNGGISAVQIHAPYQGSIDAERALVESVRAEIDATGVEGLEIWRAVSMTGGNGAEGALVAAALSDDVDKLVLDSGDGGTGQAFDWGQIPDEVKHKALLAGGVAISNAALALATGCLGLDINSGVEYSAEAGKWAGSKDAAAIRDIFAVIRRFHY